MVDNIINALTINAQQEQILQKIFIIQKCIN